MAKSNMYNAQVKDGGGSTTVVPTEVKFDDDYMEAMATHFNDYAAYLQYGVDKYIEILHNIRNNAIIEGDTAVALDTFISYADKLKDIIKESGESAKKTCENFVTTVDSKDSSFY